MIGNPGGRIAHIYIRPCLACPLDPAEQERRVRLAADIMGTPIAGVWREAALTPRQRRSGLPVRGVLLRRLGRGAPIILIGDLVVLGRSLADLVAMLAQAETCGAAVLIAADASGAVRPVSAADLEAARRAYAREAIAEGRARARARGVRFGRPTVPASKVERVRDALARGVGLRAAARRAGVGVATASRIRDAASNQ